MGTHPSLVLVLGLNLAWTLVALASPALGRALWKGEGTPVELFEVGLLLVYIGTWSWIGVRLRRSNERTLQWSLAFAMAGQLAFILGEEIDWLGAFEARNLRQASRVFLPQILDSPAAGALLVLFLLVPLVPLAAVRTRLRALSPICAEPADSAAVVVGLSSSILVFLVVGDQELGELHQLVAYGVLGVVTVRIVRRLGIA